MLDAARTWLVPEPYGIGQAFVLCSIAPQSAKSVIITADSDCSRAQGLHVMASSWPATAYMLQRKDSPALLRAPLVHDIARKLGKKPSQVLLNWAVAHGTTVSPKAGSLEHVQVRARC